MLLYGLRGREGSDPSPAGPPTQLLGTAKATTGADGTVVTWRTSSSVRGRLMARSAGSSGEEEFFVAASEGTVHRFVVPVHLHLLDDAVVRFESHPASPARLRSEAVRIKSTSLRALFDAVRHLKAQWAPRGSGVGLHREHVPQGALGTLSAPRPGLLDAPPLDGELLRHAAHVRRSLRPILASPFVEQEVKLRLFAVLTLLQRIDILLVARGAPSRLNWSLVHTPFVRLEPLKGEPYGRAGWPAAAVRTALPEKQWDFRPMPLATGGVRRLADSIIKGGYDKTEQANAIPSRTYRFELAASWLNRCRGRALLYLVVRMRLPWTLFRLTLNRRLPMNLWLNRRREAPNHRFQVVFEVPSFVLEAGTNQLDATLLPAASRFTLDFGSIEAFAVLPGSLADWPALSAALE